LVGTGIEQVMGFGTDERSQLVHRTDVRERLLAT
jgi:hypothetical protein